MLHSHTAPVRKRALLTTRSSIDSRAPHWRTVLQNGQDITQKASSKKRNIMEYSPEILQDAKSLRKVMLGRCFSKVILESNVTPNISMWSNSVSRVPPIFNGRLWVTWRLSYSWSYSNKFHSPKVTSLTNPTEVTNRGLCNCNSNAWGWHNSHQRSHQHNQSICFTYSKKARKCTGGTITGPNNNAALLTQR